MLGKAGLVALAMTPVFGATHTADLRELYNEMYPVNALKRDAFNLCHESDAMFVRALQADRESCYDRMPHNIALAIGRVRPGTELSALSPNLDEPARAALFLAQIANLPIRQHIQRPQQVAVLAEAETLAGSPSCGSLAAAVTRGTHQAGALATAAAAHGPTLDEAAFAALTPALRDATAWPRLSARFTMPATAPDDAALSGAASAGGGLSPILEAEPQPAAAGTAACSTRV